MNQGGANHKRSVAMVPVVTDDKKEGQLEVIKGTIEHITTDRIVALEGNRCRSGTNL